MGPHPHGRAHHARDQTGNGPTRHPEPREVPVLSEGTPASFFTTPDRPTWELYARCIHCGLCLESCPTYQVLRREADSPRGRIYQILQADAGRLPIGDSFVLHMDRCLGCRACETACPSGVAYGRILERTRAEIEQNYRRPLFERKLRKWFFETLLTDRRKLMRAASALRFYQRSGLQPLVRATGILRLLGLQDLERLAPPVDSYFFYNAVGQVFPAVGPKRARVAFLAGCIANVTHAELNRKTIRVLNENGIEVTVPAGQGCCGALHHHAGYLDEARQMARGNIDAFLAEPADAIISNAAGCGAMLKEYDLLLADDPVYAERAIEFTSRVRDVSEYLTGIGLRPPRRKMTKRVTYQDSCHLAHAQGIRSAPRELIRAVCSDFTELTRADDCCGSAGTYNVVQTELSMKILDQKMDAVAATGAEVLATANVGCMLQLQAGVARWNLQVQVCHVIELLDECY